MEENKVLPQNSNTIGNPSGKAKLKRHLLFVDFFPFPLNTVLSFPPSMPISVHHWLPEEAVSPHHHPGLQGRYSSSLFHPCAANCWRIQYGRFESRGCQVTPEIASPVPNALKSIPVVVLHTVKGQKAWTSTVYISQNIRSQRPKDLLISKVPNSLSTTANAIQGVSSNSLKFLSYRSQKTQRSAVTHARILYFIGADLTPGHSP